MCNRKLIGHSSAGSSHGGVDRVDFLLYRLNGKMQMGFGE